MTIRKKILLGFGAIALIGVILGATGFFSVANLTGQSKELHELAAENLGICSVLNAHYVWRQGITEAVLTESAFTGSVDPNTCALGKWLGSDEAKRIDDPQILSMLASIKEPHEYIHTEARQIVAYIEAGNRTEAMDHLVNGVLPKTQEVITLLTQMQERYNDLSAQKTNSILSLGAGVETALAVIIILAVILCVFLTILVTKEIIKPLIPLAAFMNKAGTTGDITLSQEDMQVIGQYTQIKDEIGKAISACALFVDRIGKVSGVLGDIAGGDLTVELSPLSEQDVMGVSLEKMTDSLNRMFSDIHASADQVTSGSKQVADGAQGLAQGATEQAASIEELSGSIAEIADKTKSNAAMADKAAGLAETIRQSAEKGARQMDEMMTAVNEINEAGSSISKVIKVIDDIAFQTNILALNAAVEAARAGAAGKGFAVVAEEVRNLAAKSAEAAKSTGDLIENSIEKASLGVRIAEDTAASLTEIVEGINESNSLVMEIARSSEEQAAGITQINIGIDQVAQVVQQNSATAEESAAASEQMSGQSTMLQELIRQFRIKEAIYGGSAGYPDPGVIAETGFRRPPKSGNLLLNDDTLDWKY